MKKKITFILISMVCLFFTSCGNGPDPCPVIGMSIQSRSIIGAFYHVEGLNLRFVDTCADNIPYISAVLKTNYGRECENPISLLSTGNDFSLFESLIKLYGDTGYNKTIKYERTERGNDYYYNFGASINRANLEQVIAIDVTSNVDWDDVHPARTSLNDLITFVTYTQRLYIQNGYKGDVIKSDSYENVGVEPFWQSMLLSEMEPVDFLLTMNSGYLYFKFNSEPISEKTHTITVTLHLDDGRTIQDSVDCSFE